MFFDIGWPELMLIGVVALVVIGPKDLPAALRVAGYWVRKARTLSREFHSSVEQMLREAELHEVQNELRKATDINLDHEFNKIMDSVNEPLQDPALAPPARDIPDHFELTPAPADPQPEPLAAAPAEAEPHAVASASADEPELPLGLPASPPAGQPEPAHLSEPSKS